MIEVKSMFVSSTSDLTEERETIRNMIWKYHFEREVLPYISDFDMRPGATPEERLLEELQNADLFVIVLGGRHGSLYPVTGEQVPMSMCEWEFQEARKRRLEILSMEKVLPPEDIEEPQRRFRERARQLSGAWRKVFSDQNELAEILIRVLTSWRRHELKRGLPHQEVLTGVFLTIAVLLFFSLPFLDHFVSRTLAAGGVGMAVVALIGFSGQNLLRIFRR